MSSIREQQCLHCHKITELTIYDELCGIGRNRYPLCRSCYYKDYRSDCLFFIFFLLICYALFNILEHK